MRFAVALLMVALVAVACDDVEVDCRPTRTTADAAQKVNLSQPGDSSTLHARLTTARDRPLSGKTLVVEVLDDGDAVYTDEARTDADGNISVQLVGKLDPNAVQGVARGDAWRATFDGDPEFCSSNDRAPFQTANAP